MIITKDMERYIKLQRTGYGNADTEECYERGIQKDYDSIKSYLPESCSCIMDIGYGIAGIDLFLSKHYNNNVELHLLDYSKVDKSVYYGYQSKGSVYNSLLLSAEFLNINGVSEKQIVTHDAENGFYCKPYDIIISLISCGFHYPVETYLKEIKQCKAGIVILDIRKDTDQIKILKDNFNSVEIIAGYLKHERVLLK